MTNHSAEQHGTVPKPQVSSLSSLHIGPSAHENPLIKRQIPQLQHLQQLLCGIFYKGVSKRSNQSFHS